MPPSTNGSSPASDAPADGSHPDAGSGLLIHLDGSCFGRNGAGGWAAILDWCDGAGRSLAQTVLTGGEAASTNNRMELAGAIAALRATPGEAATLISDSHYLVKGITRWVGPWRSRGWRNGRGERVANRDLWRELDALAAGRDLRWVWTKGHAGNAGNEAADRLAYAEASSRRAPARR